MKVVLDSLVKRADLNGKSGVIVRWMQAANKYLVQLDMGLQVRVCVANFSADLSGGRAIPGIGYGIIKHPAK